MGFEKQHLAILILASAVIFNDGCSKKQGSGTGATGGGDVSVAPGANTPDGQAVAPGAGAGLGAGLGSGAGVGTAGSSSEKVAPPARECFTVTYHHKKLGDHADGEICSLHKNLVKLKHPKVNFKSLCVKVNGTPVKYEKTKGGVLVAAIAGPNAKITARYCLDQANCSDECKIPRDEFMDAIGGAEDEVAHVGAKKGKKKSAKWDPNDKSEDADISAEFDGELARELAGGGNLNVFDGWVEETESPACGTQGASVKGSGTEG